MITIHCPTCKQHVNYVYLKIDEPKCKDNHPLGKWVMCNGSNGNHVFLNMDPKEQCPVCGDKNKLEVPKGTKVKCMKPYPEGKTCPTPEYEWLVSGPPCNLNHIDILLVKK